VVKRFSDTWSLAAVVAAAIAAAFKVAVAWVDRCGCGRKIFLEFVVHIPVKQGVFGLRLSVVDA
jgi:hypothetical protein